MNRMRYFLLSLLMLALFGCEDPAATANATRNIRAFYFPVDELYEGSVYEYESIGNKHDPPFYWYYRTINIEDKTYFTGMYYDYTFTPFQFIREEVLNNGMQLEDFYWYQTDSTSGLQEKVPVNIESANIFPFQVSRPPGVLVSSINWELPEDTATTVTFIRNRQFDNDTSILYKNVAFEGINMHVLELIDTENQGHLEQEYTARETYAKGIGLVYFEKNIDPQWQMKYRLKDTYSMEEFLQKAQPPN